MGDYSEKKRQIIHSLCERFIYFIFVEALLFLYCSSFFFKNSISILASAQKITLINEMESSLTLLTIVSSLCN